MAIIKRAFSTFLSLKYKLHLEETHKNFSLSDKNTVIKIVIKSLLNLSVWVRAEMYQKYHNSTVGQLISCK